MSFAPPQIVEGITRQPLSYGLFSVLSTRTDAEPHWQNGIQWEALTCAPVSGIGDPDCAPDGSGTAATGLPKNLGPNGNPLGEATPFNVYGTFVCNPVGHTLQYAQDRATQQLLAREEARVEQALWTGDLDNTGFATDAEDVGSGSLLRSVARLVQWLATNYGSQGVIHMTVEAAEIGLSDAVGVLNVVGGQIRTRTGIPVVAGAGYPGTGPTGQDPAANSSYIYATPALLGYRSDVFPGTTPIAAGLDRGQNLLHAVMERSYVIGFDPCGTAFALADLPE